MKQMETLTTKELAAVPESLVDELISYRVKVSQRPQLVQAIYDGLRASPALSDLHALQIWPIAAEVCAGISIDIANTGAVPS